MKVAGGRLRRSAVAIFADYLSHSWAYAFRLTSGSVQVPVCIVGTATGTPKWIADGFPQFVELYVRDDERLYAADDWHPTGCALVTRVRIWGARLVKHTVRVGISFSVVWGSFPPVA